MIRRTKGRESIFIVGLHGMGQVGVAAEGYLKEKLEAKRVDYLEPSGLFQAAPIVIREGLIIPSGQPECEFFKASHPSEPYDIFFFHCTSIPLPGKEEEFIWSILNRIRNHNPKWVITFSALPSPIDHYMDPKVWAVATDSAVLDELSTEIPLWIRGGQLEGLNGLLLAYAKSIGLSGFCLIPEIPYYTTQMENPRAAMAVLAVLGNILKMEVDLRDLEEISLYAEQEIDLFLRQLKEEGFQEDQIEDEGPEYYH